MPVVCTGSWSEATRPASWPRVGEPWRCVRLGMYWQLERSDAAGVLAACRGAVAVRAARYGRANATDQTVVIGGAGRR